MAPVPGASSKGRSGLSLLHPPPPLLRPFRAHFRQEIFHFLSGPGAPALSGYWLLGCDPSSGPAGRSPNPRGSPFSLAWASMAETQTEVVREVFRGLVIFLEKVVECFLDSPLP